MGSGVSVVGFGTTGVGRWSERSVLSLASEAVDGALKDSGFRRADIDGIISHIGSSRGIDHDLAASALDLDVRYAAQPWSHGRFGATVLQQAAAAIIAGLADRVICLAAYRNTPWGQVGGREGFGFDESLRPGRGPHAETPWAALIGPLASAAMATTRYFHDHRASSELLAAVPIAMRKHAHNNPLARMAGKPMTREDYLAAPYIVEPLRLLDCSVVVDGAVAIILARDDVADGETANPVRIAGMQGLSAGRATFIFSPVGQGLPPCTQDGQRSWSGDQPVYRSAGVKPSDVDLVQIYDAFSPLVPFTLERLGYCGAGEGLDFVQDGRIEPGGELPVNTSGGMLSEGHLNGWPQFVEIIRQLRGQADARQVAGAAVAQWGTALGDSIIFTKPQLAGDRS